jgi:hypothetical protein
VPERQPTNPLRLHETVATPRDDRPVEPIDPRQIPSIRLVEEELDREEISYRNRANGIDTKAGLILTAAGVLVALVGTRPSVAGLVGQMIALLAATVGGAALFPRVDKGISASELRDRYLSVDASITRMVLLNTRIELHLKDEQRLITKAWRLRLASLLLVSAAVAIVVGAIIHVARGG